jgi:hypothetical protein
MLTDPFKSAANNTTLCFCRCPALLRPNRCRFVVNHLGNKSVALSPDIPHHVLRPVRVNCPAPAVKYVVGAGHKSPADHTDGSSYAAAGTPCSRSTTRSCLLPVCWEYQQVCLSLGRWTACAARLQGRQRLCKQTCGSSSAAAAAPHTCRS